MKNKKFIPLLLVAVISFIGILNSIGVTNIYSQSIDNSKEYSVEISSNTTTSNPKPSSGSFNSKPSNNYNNSNSGSNKDSYSTIKPDSGSFSTKPNTTIPNENKENSSTIKPDSGTFNTKPETNNNTNQPTDDKKYDDDSGSYTPTFSGGNYYGSYGFLNNMIYGFMNTSWITKFVIIATTLVLVYIAFDYIRSKRDDD